MRVLNKVLATVLVVAMMMSLVVINVSAAITDGFAITYQYKKALDGTGADAASVKAEKDVYVDIYATPLTYEAMTVMVVPAIEGASADNISTTYTGCDALYNTSSGQYYIGWSSPLEVVEGKPLATIKFTIPAGTVKTDSFKLFDVDGNNGYASGTVNGTFDDIELAAPAASVAVAESFTATKAETQSTTASYEIGTDVVAELAKMPVTVKNDDGTKTEDGYTAVWTCATADADLTVPGTYTFNGTVSDSQVSEDNAASWEGDLATESVSVTMTAIAGDVTDVEDVEKVEIRKTETALAAGDITKELPSTLKVAKNGIEDTVDVVWTATPDATFGTVEGATLEVTGALAATSTNSKFTFDNKTVKATIEIIPATVANASIDIKSKSIYAKPTITITVPASELKPNTEVPEGEGEDATITVTGNNEIVVTLAQENGASIVLTATALKSDDFTISGEGDDAVASYTITGTETLDKLGVESGESVTISATLNKAELVVGTEDVTDEDGNVTGTTDVTSLEIKASKPIKGSSPGIRPDASVNNNNNGQNNQTGITGTPGTETPGTDAPVVKAPFEDVAGDHWAAEAIAVLKDAGIVGGVTATTFAPDADITRAEFTKMVVGLLKLEATSTEVAFEDCGAEDWFTPYVAAAVEAGLVTGVSDTEFAPNATITREQAFAIIGRAVVGVEANTTLAFSDAAEVSEYAVPYVTILAQVGIVEGFGDNTVRPQANITRAEAAKVIAGLMKMVVTEEVAEETTVDETEK